MSNRKLSAKDKAFEKERITYRQRIRQLESTISSLKVELATIKGEVAEKDEKIRQLEDWVNRLLEYTELSEEEMKRVLEKDKTVSEVFENVKAMQSIFVDYSINQKGEKYANQINESRGRFRSTY